ncbi:hypothetical protein GYB22_00935 [bacterium]|nr:hypothetical protein [bacterium]
MLRNFAFILLFFSLGLFVSCDEDDPLTSTENVIIKGGETEKVDDLKIQFTSVLEDSRCPEEGTCTWAGRVIVELVLNQQDTVNLGLGDLSSGVETPYRSSAKYEGYELELLSAEFGAEENQAKTPFYSINLKVTH